jgi:calcineurin-like phosphoesterase
VLGMDKKACVTKQKYLCPVKFEVAKGEGFVNGVVIDIDTKTRRAVSIDKIHIKFN